VINGAIFSTLVGGRYAPAGSPILGDKGLTIFCDQKRNRLVNFFGRMWRVLPYGAVANGPKLKSRNAVNYIGAFEKKDDWPPKGARGVNGAGRTVHCGHIH